MKSYQQHCSVARALDIVGDRWTLLIVRELLAFGPSRYIDLTRGLPGIATNLLAERLRAMEEAALVERYDAPPPIASSLYRLTPRGRELQDVLHALARWGLESMKRGAQANDAVQPQWTALLAGMELAPHITPGTEIVVGVETGGDEVRAVLRHDAFEIRRGSTPEADVTLSGQAELVGAVVSGLLTPDQATSRGLEITGTSSVLTDLLGADAGPAPARTVL
jgi:DNA-binding HxlR family transcriptional regulator